MMTLLWRVRARCVTIGYEQPAANLAQAGCLLV